MEFSYSRLIENSKKKIKENCTPDTEDLFKRIFDPNGETRITFAEIREHALFEKYFPILENNHASRILYGNKFQSKIIKPKKSQGKEDDPE